MAPVPTSSAGGGGRIRTYEGISQQIYSLPPLAAWVPLLKMSRVFCGASHVVSMGFQALRAGPTGSKRPRPRRYRGPAAGIDAILRYIYRKIRFTIYLEIAMHHRFHFYF